MKLKQRIAIAYYRTKFKTLAVLSARLAAEKAFELFCTPYNKKQFVEAPAEFEKAEKLSFNKFNYKIACFRWKPTENQCNKRILICHGFDSRSYNFNHFITPLLKEGYEVLAFDAPGHGLTSGTTINISEYSEIILEVNKLYGPINGFMAHSLGGIALALAMEKMDEKEHKRMVLISPATETTRSIQNFFSYITLSTKVKEEFEKIIIEKGGQPSSWYSVARVIKSLPTPTLWIHDTTDLITPYEDMEHLTKIELPHTEFEITTGLGHSNIYRKPEIVKKIISFFNVMKNE